MNSIIYAHVRHCESCPHIVGGEIDALAESSILCLNRVLSESVDFVEVCSGLVEQKLAINLQ